MMADYYEDILFEVDGPIAVATINELKEQRLRLSDQRGAP
jgi:hypothetical protein